MPENEGLFVVRLWDGMDGYWIDITGELTKEEADKIWNEKTKGGTQNTEYRDIDYYRIFPADTQMLYDGRLSSED